VVGSMRVYNFDELKQIAFELKNNKAAIVETDTVMGIVSLNQDLIYRIKQRPRGKKIILFVNDIRQVNDLSKKEQEVISEY